MKTIEEKAKAYDKVRKKIAIRFGSNVADEFFAEFEGSKDEEIRKALLEMVHDTTGDELWIDYNVHKENALAWLEKQGKKPADSYCQENCKGYQETGKCFADGMCKARREAEQKPEENKGNIGGISSNWSEEDEQRLNSCLNILQPKTFVGNTETINTKWLKSLKDRVQPKQEWTEEEIEPIISDYLCGREHYEGMIGRLCHLKPKQKQTEWGEDDKAFLDDILCKLEHDLILNKDEKDWIKSLRPQNRWKPSELQLGCLSDAIKHYNSLGYPAPKLKELLDDLKKLKGEV